MRCAKFFQLVFIALCASSCPCLAQDTAAATDDSKIQIIDAASDSSEKPGKEKKSDSKNAEVVNPPKMAELAKQPVYWMCKNKSDVRTMRVEAESGTCTTKYSKEGSERVVSQSTASRTCYQVFANIRRNLEGASYKCRDISTSRISSSY